MRFITPAVYLCLARKYSGKTHLLKYIIANKIRSGELDYGIVICGTNAGGGWDGIVPDKFIHQTYNEEVIIRLLKIQARNPHLRAFIVLDDIVGTVKRSARMIEKLATCGRHDNISLFICIQRLTNLSNTIRDNVDYAFFFKQPNKKNLETIYEEFGHTWDGDRDSFINFFKNNIHSYRALIINNMVQSNNPADIYATMIAPAKYKIPKLEYNYD